MHVMIEAFDSGDNPIGLVSVPEATVQDYLDKAADFGWPLDLSDFALLDGRLSIDSQDPDDYMEELRSRRR